LKRSVKIRANPWLLFQSQTYSYPSQAIMIKLYCITKKAGLTDEECFRYWKDVHGSVDARIPRLRKLIQSHRSKIPGDKRGFDYDGVAELWFDNVDALLAARESQEWRASAEDEENFIDLDNVAYFVSEEHVILNTSG